MASDSRTEVSPLLEIKTDSDSTTSTTSEHRDHFSPSPPPPSYRRDSDEKAPHGCPHHHPALPWHHGHPGCDAGHGRSPFHCRGRCGKRRRPLLFMLKSIMVIAVAMIFLHAFNRPQLVILHGGSTPSMDIQSGAQTSVRVDLGSDWLHRIEQNFVSFRSRSYVITWELILYPAHNVAMSLSHEPMRLPLLEKRALSKYPAEISPHLSTELIFDNSDPSMAMLIQACKQHGVVDATVEFKLMAGRKRHNHCSAMSHNREIDEVSVPLSIMCNHQQLFYRTNEIMIDPQVPADSILLSDDSYNRPLLLDIDAISPEQERGSSFHLLDSSKVSRRHSHHNHHRLNQDWEGKYAFAASSGMTAGSSDSMGVAHSKPIMNNDLATEGPKESVRNEKLLRFRARLEHM